MLRQLGGRLVPDVADTQAENKLVKIVPLGIFNCGQQVVRAFLFELVQLQQVFLPQRIQIRNRVHKAAVCQLDCDGFAQAVDRHRIAGGKMNQVAQALGRAFRVYAAQRGFAFQVGNRRAAGRAGRRHFVIGRACGMACDADDFRDDIAGLAHPDGIPDPDAEGADDIGVVQARTGNACACQEDRVKHGGWGEHAGAANRDFHFPQNRFLDFGRILEGNRPARELVGAAKRFTRGKVVYLNNGAVNIKCKRTAPGADRLNLPNGILDRIEDAVARRYREAERFEIVERFTVIGKAAPAHLLQVKHKDRKPAGCRDPCILLPQRAGRRIARILERRFFLQFLLFFQCKERLVRHIHLAAHFQKLRRVEQDMRDIFHGGDIFGHIFTDKTVAAGGPAYQAAVFVFQADRKAVDLGFHNITRRDARFPHAGVKITQFVVRKSVLQAFHLDGVCHLAELAARRFIDMLGRRIGGDKRRVLGFQCFEFPGQGIVLKIFKLGGVIHIVEAVVALNHFAQFRHTFACLFKFHGFSPFLFWFQQFQFTLTGLGSLGSAAACSEASAACQAASAGVS